MRTDELDRPIPRMNLTLILVDSELELVPEEYWSHPAVVQNARKRKKKPSMVLLDSSLHHSVFKNDEDKNRRGRPDIVHQFLLLGLDSVLNSQGCLRLFVHTRNDVLIKIDPTTRLPKNYNRYSGLFEELLRTGSVPAGRNPLIRTQDGMDLGSAIDMIMKECGMDRGRSRTICLHPDGPEMDSWEFFGKMKEEDDLADVICLIGGFSSGVYRSPVERYSDIKLTIPGGTLKVWTVVSELLVGFRAGMS
ncbi:MAG: 16S rRNA methyltransferase [Thermoplasmatota archaeon]